MAHSIRNFLTRNTTLIDMSSPLSEVVKRACLLGHVKEADELYNSFLTTHRMVIADKSKDSLNPRYRTFLALLAQVPLFRQPEVRANGFWLHAMAYHFAVEEHNEIYPHAQKRGLTALLFIPLIYLLRHFGLTPAQLREQLKG